VLFLEQFSFGFSETLVKEMTGNTIEHKYRAAIVSVNTTRD